MHWLIYDHDEKGRLFLKMITSPERPTENNILNGGFTDPSQALHMMAFYLQFDAATGETRLNMERRARAFTRIDRVRLAYAIEPLLGQAVIGAYMLIGMVFVLLLCHMVWG